MSEKTMWGIHAGSKGEADSLFIAKSVLPLVKGKGIQGIGLPNKNLEG